MIIAITMMSVIFTEIKSYLKQDKMKNMKQCKVIRLPAAVDSDSKLYLNSGGALHLYTDDFGNTPNFTAQHLYLVSNDEIKEDDWVYLEASKSLRRILPNDTQDPENWIVVEGNCAVLREACKKVIATTDSSLGKDCYTGIRKDMAFFPLPQIPQSFIEAYLKAQGKIDEVMVEMNEGTGVFKWANDVVKRRSDNTAIIHQAKTYTRAEVSDIIYNVLGSFAAKHDVYFDGRDITQWIEENL
jgi:hypothetical protein